MTMEDITREKFRQALVNKVGCDIQHNGWPCNSCFHNTDFGVSDDRTHELWQSVLAYRGDYTDFDFEPPQTSGLITANITELSESIS